MNLDANVNNQITRNDFAIIIALNRHLATILPVRLAYKGADYKAGQVLGRITASGLFSDYDDGHSDGTEVAACVLMEDVLLTDVQTTNTQISPSGTAVSRGIFGGEVFQAKLTGLDANGKTDLGGRTIVDASGVSILKF